MSKKPKNRAAPVDPEAQGRMASGFQDYPSSGQFPILPQANYWENGNFMMPGVGSPMMASDLLQRFPQLAELFGGRDPNQGQNTSIQPGLYGLPPSFGKSNVKTVMESDKKEERRYPWMRA